MALTQAAQNAAEFLRIADQFQLGGLVTESPHPRDVNLSETAKASTLAGLVELLEVDRDVVKKFRSWAESGEGARVARETAAHLWEGGKIFFTGCGATGRLSIQLDAMWREYWQGVARAGQAEVGVAQDWENRSFSVMAGGDFALIKSVEGFEDYTQFGRRQIGDLGVGAGDTVFAITEGGETSFVIGTAWQGLTAGARVHFVYNNPDEVLCELVKRSREVIEEPRIHKINLTTGPMAITGSTRMQATSIQLCVMSTLLEMVLAVVGEKLGLSPAVEDLNEISLTFAQDLEMLHQRLLDREMLAPVAELVEREERVYRHKGRCNYFADRLSVDVLTDTTERAPTYSLPAFKKWGDEGAAESWAFLFLPQADSAAAWRHLLKRELRAVEWPREVVAEMLEGAELEHQYAIVRSISREEILRFRIGLDGRSQREPRRGDAALAIVTGAELGSLTEPGGFYRQQLEEAARCGSETALLFLGTPEEIGRVQEFVQEWEIKPLLILVPVPRRESRLNALERIAAKLLLNTLSTLTMVKMGRVMGNVMVWVVPSNLKLIDRSIRYIRRFTDLGYEGACHLLFRALEHVDARRRAGQEYPSIVRLCVIVARDHGTFVEAEKTLAAELGLSP